MVTTLFIQTIWFPMVVKLYQKIFNPRRYGFSILLLRKTELTDIFSKFSILEIVCNSFFKEEPAIRKKFDFICAPILKKFHLHLLKFFFFWKTLNRDILNCETNRWKKISIHNVAVSYSDRSALIASIFETNFNCLFTSKGEKFQITYFTALQQSRSLFCINPDLFSFSD